MIRDADRSLGNWLSGTLPRGTGVRFDQPCAPWTSRPPDKSFIDAYLYAVRRDDDGRASSWSEVRDANGRVVGRQPAAQQYRLSYLITAWAAGTAGKGSADDGSGDRVLAEHELLGSVMTACTANEVLPTDSLEGALAATGLPVSLICAPGELASETDYLWAGLGIAPRAHVVVVLVAPVLPVVVTDLAPFPREIVLDMAQAQAVEGPRMPDPQFTSTHRWERKTVNERALPKAEDSAEVELKQDSEKQARDKQGSARGRGTGTRRTST